MVAKVPPSAGVDVAPPIITLSQTTQRQVYSTNGTAKRGGIAATNHHLVCTCPCIWSTATAVSRSHPNLAWICCVWASECAFTHVCPSPVSPGTTEKN